MENRSITTTTALESFLNNISGAAPTAVTQMFSGQLQIIRSIQSPTLVDSALSNMVEGLYYTLDCCRNDMERNSVKRQFISMIDNLIFFLDANFQNSLKNNDETARNLFVQAGDLFMDNMRDGMLLAINTFGSGVKVAATTIDHVGKDFMISVVGLGTEAIQGIAGSAFDVSQQDTTDGDTTTSTLTFHKDPASDKTIEEIGGTGCYTQDTIDKHRGEYEKDVVKHMDEWERNMTNIVIHNMFSPEQKEKQNTFFGTFYDFFNKSKKEQKLTEDFLNTMCNTIEKLGKYRSIIGPSIRISDMIERYVRVVEKNMSKDSKKWTINDYIRRATELYIFAPAVVVDVFIKRQFAKGFKPETTLENYKMIGESYNPLQQPQNPICQSFAGIPPQLPNTQYFVSNNGKQEGPFNIQQLQQLIQSGFLTAKTYVWKQGMANWDFAENMMELSHLFIQNTPPPLPPRF